MQEEGKGEGKALEFLGILWSIWLVRNKMIFNTNYRLIPTDVFRILNCWQKSWWDCCNLTSKEEKPYDSITVDRRGQISWKKNWGEPTDHSTLIINGAWKESKKNVQDPVEAAYEWVIMEANMERARGGRVKEASSAIQIEAYALLYGLRECQKYSISKVEIWTDATQVVEGIRDRTRTSSSIRNILLEASLLLKEFVSVCIIKVERTKVKKAHLLAHQARKRSTRL